MKKAVLLLCAVAVVFGSLSLVAQAKNDSAKGIVETCKWVLEQPFNTWDNLGDCVSALRSNKGPVYFCKENWDRDIEWPEGWPEEFKNLGHCVSFLRTLRPE